MERRTTEEILRDLRRISSMIDVDPEKIYAMNELRKHVRSVNLLGMALSTMGVDIEFCPDLNSAGKTNRLSIKFHDINP